jgi:hypothetical protein
MGIRALLVVGAVMVTACGGAPATAGLVESIPSTTLVILSETTGVNVGVIAAADVPEAALFLAAVDEGLAGTVYEGDSFDDPETYLGTAVLFCELLENGLSAEEVLTAYILALTEASDGADIPPDDLLLGGVILGAGVESLCPEFVERLGS